MTDTSRLPKLVLAAFVVAEVISAVLAWRDLARRTDEQVRGAKTGWRLFNTLNRGNSVAYWVIGRH